MLDLYILQTCPYCKKVIEHFDNKGIEYTIHDVSNQNEFDKLMSLGGKAQVPYLYDTDNKKGLYESDEIISYR